ESLYPHNIQPYLQDHGYRVQTTTATIIARELGDARMANTVMLGALAAYLPFSPDDWRATLETRIPLKYRAANLAAFAAGSTAP
ncbi:MAG: 2-oxoacid:acceptor oxidoreductase family protein, partial [Chloroflexi bacterium]|nr:2-oxoacid:acceptor oxidoreductase family protein [Chloroflexota bacterium]